MAEPLELPVSVRVVLAMGGKPGFEQYVTVPEILMVAAWMVMLPGGVLAGARLTRSASMK